MYRFHTADPEDDDTLELLTELHHETFGGEAPLPEFENGWWWIVRAHDGEAAGFCGVVPSSLGPGYAYLKRAGVLRSHNGHGLQRRMLQVRERRVRRLGFHTCVTDTTSNPRSSNNLIAAGYRLWEPAPWAFPHSLYWYKKLCPIK